MSDDRIPFDKNISDLGFPTTIAHQALVLVYNTKESLLSDLLNLHDQMPKCKSRLFVGKMIEMCLFHISFPDGSGQNDVSRILNLRRIQSLYEKLGDGCSLPLGIILKLLGESIQENADFFSRMEQIDTEIVIYPNRYGHLRQGVTRVYDAYKAFPENTGLLRILGLLAEHGHLSGHSVNVPHPDSFQKVEDKAASFIVMLAHETWESSDNTHLYSRFLEEARENSGDIFDRVITTIRENRLSGSFFEPFLLEFEKIMSPDQHALRAKFLDLIGNYLSRRTSRFGTSRHRELFNFPAGINTLL